jgi:hypothetical protein
MHRGALRTFAVLATLVGFGMWTPGAVAVKKVEAFSCLVGEGSRSPSEWLAKD